MKDFFVSYTQADKAWAEWIAWQLEAAGHSVVIQAWDFAPGSNFVLEMNKAAATAARTVAVLSPDYLQSNFTPSEWAAAFAVDPKSEHRKLLPICVREVDPTGLLGQIAWTDLVGADEATAKERLLAAIAGSRAKPSREPMFPGGALATSKPAFPSSGPRIWNLPPRNLHFTGRAEWIERLEHHLVAGDRSVVTQAISGLGGIGKTQLALEYAHRNAAKYDVIWWIRAETEESRQADLTELCKRLLPNSEPQVEHAIGWLGEHSDWLLVFDNVEKPDDIDRLLPRGGAGHLIITSRHGAWGKIAKPLSLEVWTVDEATAYVLARTGQDDEQAARALVAELGFLPLAVEQAAAYIEEASIGIAKYTELFKKSRSKLLKASSSKVTVATVWDISLAALKSRSSDAISLLNLLAFLPPDSFPRERLVSAHGITPTLGSLFSDEVALNDAVTILRQYSLVTATPQHISVHRLVQTVVRDRLSDAESRAFATAAHQIQYGADDAFDEWSAATPRAPWHQTFRTIGLRVILLGAVMFTAWQAYQPLQRYIGSAIRQLWAPTTVPEVHLIAANGVVSRSSEERREWRLTEPGMPFRQSKTPADLHRILKWLAVETNARYSFSAWAGPDFPDVIYAYDYCYLAGVYLPVVWWTPESQSKLLQGFTVDPRRVGTVNEMSPNELASWLSEVGTRDFGWRRVRSLDALQDAANRGEVALAIGRFRLKPPELPELPNLSQHGKIALVVPEMADRGAVRVDGKVKSPFQSVAGSYSQYVHGLNVWEGEEYEASFWAHE